MAERLCAEGYAVVPHLAAQMVNDRAGAAGRGGGPAPAAGIDSIFVPGGDAEPSRRGLPRRAGWRWRKALAALWAARTRVGGIAGLPRSPHHRRRPSPCSGCRTARAHPPGRRPGLDAQVMHHGSSGYATAASRCRCCSASRGGGRAKLLTMSTDRRRRLDALPGQAEGDDDPPRRARRLHRRALPRAVRARRWEHRRAGRGPARLHLQPGRGDRGLAPRDWLERLED